jgi:hypothetical protein
LNKVIGPNIDGASDNHLCELETGDDHRNESRWIELEGSQRVVSVHQWMNAIIHDYKPASWCCVFCIREPWVH